MRPGDNVGLGWLRRGGGRRRGGPSPLAVIMGLNIAVFVLQYVFEVGVTPVRVGREVFMQPWGGTSAELVFGRGHVWTLVTYMFVHGSLLHLALNLLLIFMCGRALLAIAGTGHFLRVYFLAGVLGALPQMLISPIPLIGASASAFGLLVALAAIIPEQQVTMLLYFVLPIRLRLKYVAYGVVGIAVLSLGIDLLAGDAANIPMVSGIGHAAHLGGALAGLLYVRFAGLGGRMVTREGLRRQRERAERRSPKGRGMGAVRAREVKRAAGRRRKGDFVSAEIDPILDKINREGFASLSDDEREILEAGSQQIADQANSK